MKGEMPAMFKWQILTIATLLAVGLSIVQADEPADAMTAARDGDTARLRAILDANPFWANCQQPDSRTPLLEAVGSAQVSAVELLLRRGANPNTRDSYNRSPLYFAFCSSRVDIARLLLDAGAEMDIFAACAAGDLASVRRHLLRNPRCLREKAADQTPLHIAAGHGQIEVLKRLIATGADVNAATSRGTALHSAAQSQRTRAVQLLLNEGAKVHVRDVAGSTPLDRAAGTGGADVVRLLLDAGADPNSNPDDHSHALVSAAANGHLEVARLLMSKAPKQLVLDESLRCAILFSPRNSFDLVDVLLNHGASANARYGQLATPLHLAASKGDTALISRLLAAKADVNAVDSAGRGALVYARLSGSAAAVAKLVEHGAKEYPLGTEAFRDDKFPRLDVSTKSATGRK